MLILFDKNENQIARLSPSELISAIQEEEINGTTTLKFECSLEAIDKLEGVEYVGHQDLTDPNSIQLYKICNKKWGKRYKIRLQSLDSIITKIAFIICNQW